MKEVGATDTTEIATSRGHSLSLRGDITLNFYVELSSDFKNAVESNVATATIGISDGDKQEIALNTAYLQENEVSVEIDGVVYKCYKFSYSVAAQNMRDNITLKLGYGEYEATINSSVQQYLTTAKSVTEADYPGLSILADKMEDYGVKAQEHFNPNAEYDDGLNGKLDISEDLANVKASTLEGYKMVKGKAVDGITPWGASLILESKVTLRLYFTKTDKDITYLNVSGVGNIDLKKYSSTIYYIDIADIAPNDLGTIYEIQSGNTTLLKCSALSYAYTVLSNEGTDDAVRGLLQSLYLYYGGAVNYVTDELPVHCACGKSDSTTEACDVCEETAVTWKPWLELDTLPTTSGNYFLLGGVALEAQQTAKDSANIYLDLNGNTVVGAENKRIYSTRGTDGTKGATLHITDVSVRKSGTLKGRGTFSANNDTIIWVAGTGSKLYLYEGNIDASNCNGVNGVAIYANGDFYMYGGTIKGGTASKQGGNVYVTGANFTMKGGIIQGGTATNQGGNMCLTSSASFTMSGGTIKNGTSTSSDGGNIYAGKNFTMTGGTITGGTAKNSYNANVHANGSVFEMSGGKITGHVRVNNATTFNLSGTSIISGGNDVNLSLNTGKTISVGELKKGAKIGITSADAVFATGAVDTDRKYFTSDSGKYIEWTTDGKLKLKDTYTVMGNNILSSLNYSVEKDTDLGTARYDAFYKAYEKYMPDVFALQEYDARWHNYMNDVNSCTTNAGLQPITSLGYQGVATTEKAVKDNNTPIYYNTNTVELIEAGWVEYEVTKEITNHGFTWAVFQPKGSDEKFIVSSTHIIARHDTITDIEETRKAQLQELVTFMKEKESTLNAPIIMLGDYNVSPVQTAYAGFELGTKIVSARDVAKIVEGSEYQTSNTLGIAPPSTDDEGTKVIDHCMISMNGIAPLKYQTLVEEISDGIYTYTYADHVPQLFTFGLSDNNGHEHSYETQWTSETNNYISHVESCACGVTNREKHTWEITKEVEDVVATCTDCNMSLTTDVARVGCYCANVDNIENHTCEEKIWMAWTRTDALPIAKGYYYLTSDVQLQDQQNIYAGAEIYLDLNGKIVTGAQNYRIYSTNEGNVSLHITDTSEETTGTLKAKGKKDDKGIIVWLSGAESQFNLYAGTIDASEFMADYGVAVEIEDNNSFTMYGGTITGGKSADGTNRNQGGSVFITSGCFTMNGGIIQDGEATNQGGNICIAGSGSFVMTGGTIKNGTSTSSTGGNIYAGGDFTMTGGTITGGTASKQGGNMMLCGDAIFDGGSITNGTASGGANSNIYIDQGYKSSETLVLNGTVNGGVEVRTMSVNGVRVGSKTNITRNSNGLGLRFIAENADKAAGVPTSTPWLALVDGCTWGQIQDNAIALSQYDGNVGATVIAEGISGTGIANFYRIVSIADNAYRPTFGADAVTITQWTGTTSVPTATGNYYLTGDISATSEKSLSSAVNIWLDLNGHTITTGNKNRLYSTTKNKSSTISIVDGSSEKDGCIDGNWNTSNTSGGGILLVRVGSTANIYGGILDASGVINTADSNGGGAIYVAGTLNVYGGHIKGGTVSYTGSAIYIPEGGSMTLDGNAVIEGGSAKYGGCIAVTNGTLTMNGGILQNGIATESGGCLYVGDTFFMNGGTITGGIANEGSNVYVKGSMNYEGNGVLQNITNPQAITETTANNWSAERGIHVNGGTIADTTATE